MRLLEKDLLWKINSSLRRLRLKETSSEENYGVFECKLIVLVFIGEHLSIK